MIVAAPACIAGLKKKPGQKAPEWLKERMEKLKKLPPPTLEEVRAQFAASEKFRKEFCSSDRKRLGARVAYLASLLNS